jgi:hypothetical protein
MTTHWQRRSPQGVAVDANELRYPILVFETGEEVGSHRSPETFAQQYGHFIRRPLWYRDLRVVDREGVEYAIESAVKGPRVGPLFDRWTLSLGWRYALTLTLRATGRTAEFHSLRTRLMKEFAPGSSRRSRGDFDESRAAVAGASDVRGLIEAFAAYDL